MLEVIFGNNEYLINSKINERILTFEKENQEGEVLRFDMTDRDFSIDNVFQASLTISLFNTKKLIVVMVRDKEAKKASEEQMLELMTTAGEVHFLIVFDKKPLAKTKIKKYIDKNALVHTIQNLTEQEQFSLIKQEAKRRKIQMNDAAIRSLNERVGDDVMRLIQELTKLESFDGAVTEEDVKILVSRALDDDIFALSDSLLKKRHQQTFQVYHDLLELKMDPLALIGLVASSLRRIYQVSALMESGFGSQQIAQQLGMSEKQAYFLVQNQAMNATRVLRLLNRLGGIDQDVKLGKVDRFVAFEMFMLDVLQA